MHQYIISKSTLFQEIYKYRKNNILAVKLNGKIEDLSSLGIKINQIDLIPSSSLEGLVMLRHDSAHILAQAIKKMYLNSMIVTGPIIENGFYYDFANITPCNLEDLKKIEKIMEIIINTNFFIKKRFISKNKAISFFYKKKEMYKIKIINSLSEKIKFAIYTQDNFSDLCRGPHSYSTRIIKAFKLTKISGVYWKNNNNNCMLQRIYGTTWSNKLQLKQYLSLVIESKKRDHRKLGKQSDLFHFQEEAQGSVFWHPKGWHLFRRLVDYIREKHVNNGYLEINTPEIMDKKLWVLSGHWSKFRKNMFTATSIEKNKLYVVRPMNCPGGIQVYNQGIKSYRHLPIKLAEFGKVYRYESSGSLHGLMRVRAFTQDDAHIFCTIEQMMIECINVCVLIKEIYKDFGFVNIQVKFSDRPKERIGVDKVWDESEKALLYAVKQQNLNYTLSRGEGAFYGPKLEFILQDAIGRNWQLGTLQVDFNLPERLNVIYIEKNGEKCRPVILHRALFGSIERFLAILLENCCGILPVWLAPIQIALISVSDQFFRYIKNISILLRKNFIRHIVDLSYEKINFKIKKHFLSKVPIIVIVGKDEESAKTVSVRRLGNKYQEILELNNFIYKLLIEIKQKRR